MFLARIGVSTWMPAPCWPAMALRYTKNATEPIVPAAHLQLSLWACLTFGAVVALLIGHEVAGVFMLVVGLVLPIGSRKKSRNGISDRVEPQTKPRPWPAA